MKKENHKLIFNLSIKDLKELGILSKKKKKRKRKRLNKLSKNNSEIYRSPPNTQGATFTNQSNLTTDNQHLQNELLKNAIENKKEDWAQSNSLIDRPMLDNNYESTINYLFNQNRDLAHKMNILVDNKSKYFRAIEPVVNEPEEAEEVDEPEEADETENNFVDVNDNIDVGNTEVTLNSQNNPDVGAPSSSSGSFHDITNETPDASFTEPIQVPEPEPEPEPEPAQEPEPEPEPTMLSPKKVTYKEAMAIIKNEENSDAVIRYKERYAKMCKQKGIKSKEELLITNDSKPINKAYNELLKLPDKIKSNK